MSCTAIRFTYRDSSEGIARDQYVVLHGQSALDRMRLELGVDLDCLEGNFRVLRGREWDTDRS